MSHGHRLLFLVACCCGCAGDPEADEVPLPPVPEDQPGVEAYVERIWVRLSTNVVSSCHAGWIGEGVLLTSAHCFSFVEPPATGGLEGRGTTFSTDDVRLHPAALQDGMKTLKRAFVPQEIRAGHDLAIIRLSDAEAHETLALWRPSPGDEHCLEKQALRGSIIRYPCLRGEEPTTASAVALTMAPPNALLGPGTGGDDQPLLVAQGLGVERGDSGGLVSSNRQSLQSSEPGCPAKVFPDSDVLLGVMQDADPKEALDPFGVVPTYLADNYQWIESQLSKAE